MLLLKKIQTVDGFTEHEEFDYLFHQYGIETRPEVMFELLDRLEAAEKDAARYRWLKRERVESNYEGELSIEFECGFDHWNDIDAAIDAAMKDEQK